MEGVLGGCLMTREEKEMGLSVDGLRQERGGALPRT
jgi:hypothetical protein